MALQSWTRSDDGETGDQLSSTESEPADPPASSSWLFRLGRALFGGILAFNALDNLWNLDERIAYAEAKNTPFPEFTVPMTSGGLLLGGIGVALWRRPSAAAALIAGFLVSVTPVMHDFWNVEDPEEKQQQIIHFLKNTALFGAALAFLKFGRRRSA
ncbi:DoxX family protein [Natrialba hulunbeirensis JCM 10989]|uniref:DoxX family protein n=1 Tax=Natrialba hulunbeirensis JCM 10989 TaxID=1227493 RepID=M0AAY7_9EURY|nr:DoxX family membrane protein [Natrialba hulunbeirensis]ELY95022.1 DoxX family protein [Natrialba hulunbeirensis JCM 10989]